MTKKLKILIEEATKCPWYKSGGWCKIDGRPCPYDNFTYEECPKYQQGEKLTNK